MWAMHGIQSEGLSSRVCIAWIQIQPMRSIIPYCGLKAHTMDSDPTLCISILSLCLPIHLQA